MTVEQEIRTLIETAFLIELSGFTDSDDLLSSGVIDSQNFLEFILVVEDNYGCEIDPMAVDLSKLVSIKGMADHLSSLT